MATVTAACAYRTGAAANAPVKRRRLHPRGRFCRCPTAPSVFLRTLFLWNQNMSGFSRCRRLLADVAAATAWRRLYQTALSSPSHRALRLQKDPAEISCYLPALLCRYVIVRVRCGLVSQIHPLSAGRVVSLCCLMFYVVGCLYFAFCSVTVPVTAIPYYSCLLVMISFVD